MKKKRSQWTCGIVRRVGKLLERRGMEPGAELLAEDHPFLAGLAATSIRSRIATGPGPARRCYAAAIAQTRRTSLGSGLDKSPCDCVVGQLLAELR